MSEPLHEPEQSPYGGAGQWKPGDPDRRAKQPLVTLGREISLGALLQVATVIGGVISAIFSAGAYVQSLRDELVSTHAQQTAKDDAILAKLQTLITTAQSIGPQK